MEVAWYDIGTLAHGATPLSSMLSVPRHPISPFYRSSKKTLETLTIAEPLMGTVVFCSILFAVGRELGGLGIVLISTSNSTTLSFYHKPYLMKINQIWQVGIYINSGGSHNYVCVGTRLASLLK